MRMEPQRWAAIESLYQQALEHNPIERSAWLQQACGSDAILRQEVESLLACADANLSNPAARPDMAKLWNHLAGHSGIDSQSLSYAAADDSSITSPSTGM